MASISPPVRVFALVAVLAAVGFAAFVFLTGRSQAAELTAAPTPAVTPSPVKPAPAATKPAGTRKAPVRTPKSGFPAPVDRALRYNRVVVIALYLPGAAVDAQVRAEARAGAARARVGFVALSAASERLVRPLIAKTGVLPQPAVVIVRRPGVVKATLGVTDAGTVAQAALQAKS